MTDKVKQQAFEEAQQLFKQMAFQMLSVSSEFLLQWTEHLCDFSVRYRQYYIDKWIKNGFILPSLDRQDYYRLSPELHLSLIERYRDEKEWIQDTSFFSNSNNSSLEAYSAKNLLQEMTAFLQKKNYLSHRKESDQTVQFLEITVKQYDIVALIEYAMSQDAWIPFFLKLSRLIPSALYRTIVASQRFQLQNPSLIFEQTYFMGDKKFEKTETTDLTFNYQALMDMIRGDFSSAKQRLTPDNLCGRLVSAVIQAYSGDNLGALKIFDTIFLYEKDDSYVNYDSFCMFVYAHCLINVMNMHEENISDTSRDHLIWLKMNFSTSNKIWMDLLVSMALKVPTNQLPVLNGSNHASMCPYDAILTSLVLRYNYSYEQISIPMLVQAEELLLKSDYSLLQLELFHCCHDESDKYEELSSKLNVISPVIYGDLRKPKWQLVLDQLMHDAPEVIVEKEKPVQKTRFIYFLTEEKENQDYSFQPRLQRSKDGIHWTEGRNIILESFAMQSDSYSELDKKIALQVKLVRYEHSQQHELKGRDIMELLIDHPNVYLSEDDLIPVQIKRSEFHIQVTQTEEGFLFSSNFPFNYETHIISVVHEHSHLFKVFRLTSKQRELVRAFREVHLFPLEAEPRLIKLLNRVGQHTLVMCSNCELLTSNIRSVNTDSSITVRIQPLGKGFTIELFVAPFGVEGPHLKPASGTAEILATINGERVRTKRDFSSEQEHLSAVRNILDKIVELDMDKDEYLIPNVSCCLQILEAFYFAQEHCRLEWPAGQQLQITRYIDTSNFTLSVNKIKSWFEVDAEIVICEDRTIKISELLSRLHASTGRYIRIGETEYLAISEQLRRILFQLESIGTKENKKLRIHQLALPVLQDIEEQGVEIIGNKEYIKFLRGIQQAEEKQYDIPHGLNATLREYQKEGFLWMCRLAEWGTGCCLADDMGIGKTIQAITLLLSRRSKGASLVISPVALTKNWEREIEQFAPALNTHVLNDKKLNRESLIDQLGNCDIVIASYGILLSEMDSLSSREWNTIILDEAHIIKNKDTKLFSVAAELNGKFRILLSGTPIQNNLSELWPLFHFCNPGLLGTYSEFRKKYIIPLEKGENKDLVISLIKKVISPFILRRTKNEVLSELPERSESIIPIQLSDEELTLYENLRRNALSRLENEKLTTVETLAELMKLRRVACNPRLLDPNAQIESSKLNTLLAIVDNLITYKHRALIFSQFTSHLTLVKKALDEKGIDYLYYDGSLSTRERNRVVKEFQAGQTPLFLISLKAGGTGLNLTAADYVIHLDPWWNPAVEDQASDRAVRIGQQKPVTIFKLVALHTIEEKIVQMHENKRLLVDTLLSGTDSSFKLTKDDVLQLLSN